MRTILILAAVLAAFLMGQVLAAPTAKYLIDATPGEGVLISLDDWFAKHPVKEGEARSDNVFHPPAPPCLSCSVRIPKASGGIFM